MPEMDAPVVFTVNVKDEPKELNETVISSFCITTNVV